MRVTWNGKTDGERIVALGAFDGVHRGHRQLLETGIAWGRERGILLRACTFDRHPLEVIRPEMAPKLLTTLPEKIGCMAEIGVDELRIIPFPREKANQEPEEFLRELRAECRLRAVIAGWNYTFGKRGRGDAELLKEDGRRYGYEVLIVPPVKTRSDLTISSTEIRKALEAGDAALAAELLGRPWSLCGLARESMHPEDIPDFPAAGIEISRKKLLPASGVYACLAEHGGETAPAIAYIGTCASDAEPVPVEVRLLEGRSPEPGEKTRLRLVDLLREDAPAGTPPERAEQLEADRKEARFLFGMA